MLSVCVGCLINVSVRLPPFSVPVRVRVGTRACAKDPERMLFSSFVVTNRRPVEKGVMRRAASQLTPDISFEPDRWGTVAGRRFPTLKK